MIEINSFHGSQITNELLLIKNTTDPNEEEAREANLRTCRTEWHLDFSSGAVIILLAMHLCSRNFFFDTTSQPLEREREKKITK